MATVKKLETITVEDYLAAESKSDIKHELINGQMYARVGASGFHNLIAGSLFAKLRSHLNAPCHVFMSDMKVRVNSDFYYPDIVVSCEPVNDTTYYLNEPSLIIEILSLSTEGRDRIEKSMTYRSLPSLKEYVLVSQDKLVIELIRRVDDEWIVETFQHGDEVSFQSIDFSIGIDAVYEDVAKHLWHGD
jgi:Uma2 family endonuclease